MDERAHIDYEAAVTNLLTLSSREPACNCKCLCEDPSDDIVGWHSFKKWKIDKNSPGKTRNKTSTSRRGETQLNTNFGGNPPKGPILRKKDDISRHTDSLLVSNLHKLESPEDHVNFYTEHYASTKGTENVYSEDEIYNPRPGDLNALGLRLKILEFLSDAYKSKTPKGFELPSSSTPPFPQAMLRLRPPDFHRSSGSPKKEVSYGKISQDRNTITSSTSLGVRKHNSDFLMVVSSPQTRKPRPTVPKLAERLRPTSSGNIATKSHRAEEAPSYRLSKYALPSRQSGRKDGKTMGRINIDRCLSNIEVRNNYSIPNRYMQDPNTYLKRSFNKLAVSYSDSDMNR